MTKIVVPISDEERILLVQMALQNSCHPREQARTIIRNALFSRLNNENAKALPVTGLGNQFVACAQRWQTHGPFTRSVESVTCSRRSKPMKIDDWPQSQKGKSMTIEPMMLPEVFKQTLKESAPNEAFTLVFDFEDINRALEFWLNNVVLRHPVIVSSYTQRSGNMTIEVTPIPHVAVG